MTASSDYFTFQALNDTISDDPVTLKKKQIHTYWNIKSVKNNAICHSTFQSLRTSNFLLTICRWFYLSWFEDHCRFFYSETEIERCLCLARSWTTTFKFGTLRQSFIHQDNPAGFSNSCMYSPFFSMGVISRICRLL